MSETPPGGVPPDDLTPPGPATEPEPEPAKSHRAIMDAWIAENVGRSETANPYAATGSPYGSSSRADSWREEARASTSRKMAGWALGLSLVFCIPFGFLVAIGLAIAVLVRGRNGGDHGKGRAIAALVISGLIVMANVVYVVVVVFTGVDTTERDADGRVMDGGSVTLDRLRLGDCFNEPNLDDLPTDGSEGQASATVSVVPCAESHQAELFHIIEPDDGDFPGQQAMDRRALDCVPEFEEFVGTPYRRSRLDFVIFFPTTATWRFGDHTILCSVTERDLSDVTGSLRNSRR